MRTSKKMLAGGPTLPAQCKNPSQASALQECRAAKAKLFAKAVKKACSSCQQTAVSSSNQATVSHVLQKLSPNTEEPLVILILASLSREG